MTPFADEESAEGFLYAPQALFQGQAAMQRYQGKENR